MKNIISSFNTKIFLLETLADIFKDNIEIQKLYLDSVDLAKRSVTLTKRFYRFKYVICKFVAIARYIETSNNNINDDLFLDYEVYINNICVESNILFGLSSTRKSSDSPIRIINESLKLQKKANEMKVQNTFLNITGYLPRFNEFKEEFKKFKKDNNDVLEIIKDNRNQYSAHNDLDFKDKEINIDKVIEGFIILNNAWYEMLKTIGVLSEQFNSSIKSWTLDDFHMETTRFFNLITKESV